MRAVAAVGEQLRRDVAEDHVPGRADQLERAEADQAVAAADVEERLALGDAGVGEDAIADRDEAGEGPLQGLLVTAVASPAKPLGPGVGGGSHAYLWGTQSEVERRSRLIAKP